MPYRASNSSSAITLGTASNERRFSEPYNESFDTAAMPCRAPVSAPVNAVQAAMIKFGLRPGACCADEGGGASGHEHQIPPDDGSQIHCRTANAMRRQFR